VADTSDFRTSLAPGTSARSEIDPTSTPGGRSRTIRIGISSCLLGRAVRFDGGHKRDPFLTDTFGPFVEWVPVCPEMECGLGTPRESMRLVQVGDQVRLLTVRTRADLTERMDEYALQRVADLEEQDLSGYVLKKDSPSCGLHRVKTYGPQGAAARSGRGVYATRLCQRFPNLPVEDEGRLSDPRLRDNFVERVFAYWRLRALFDSHWTVAALVRFHTAHKLLVMAHSTDAYQQLGRLVAGARSTAADAIERSYSDQFMAALSCVATPRRHTNVLQHMAGYFKQRLDRNSKAELLAAIEDYRRQLVPLVVPLTLLRHHVRVHEVAYLAGQVYLEPHPKELMLRNHV
jgi:uncharacterized protein YbgA (DUF1722 family)/uncharacterized protein YbbK (DUF523 family)